MGRRNDEKLEEIGRKNAKEYGQTEMDRMHFDRCFALGHSHTGRFKKQDAGTQESVQTTETESSSYVEQMERELEDLLGQMDGVGAVGS